MSTHPGWLSLWVVRNQCNRNDTLVVLWFPQFKYPSCDLLGGIFPSLEVPSILGFMELLERCVPAFTNYPSVLFSRLLFCMGVLIFGLLCSVTSKLLPLPSPGFHPSPPDLPPFLRLLVLLQVLLPSTVSGLPLKTVPELPLHHSTGCCSPQVTGKRSAAQELGVCFH